MQHGPTHSTIHRHPILSLVPALLAAALLVGGCSEETAPPVQAPAEAPAAQDDLALQRADYPLETCVVSGERLGSMGDPHEYLHEGTLVLLCCPPCEGDVAENPETFLSRIEEAGS